jgi:hypothetical protein
LRSSTKWRRRLTYLVVTGEGRHVDADVGGAWRRPNVSRKLERSVTVHRYGLPRRPNCPSFWLGRLSRSRCTWTNIARGGTSGVDNHDRLRMCLRCKAFLDAFKMSENYEGSVNYRFLPHGGVRGLGEELKQGTLASQSVVLVTLFISSSTALEQAEWRILKTWVPWRTRFTRTPGRSFHVSGYL